MKCSAAMKDKTASKDQAILCGVKHLAQGHPGP